MALKTWTAASGGNWSLGTNWNGGLPGKGDSVLINQTLGGAYIVTLDASEPSNGSVNEGYTLLTVGNANAILALSAAGKALIVHTANNKALTTLSAGTIDISNSSTLATDFFAMTGGTFLQSDGLLGVVSDRASGSDFSVSGGTFTLSGGDVHVVNDASFTGGTNTISGGTFTADTLTVGATTITLGGGDFVSTTTITNSGILIGSGTLTGKITGTGVVEASGGTLQLPTAIAAGSGLTFDISDNAASSLQLDAATGTGNTFTFLGSVGNLAIGGAFKDNVAGLNVGTSATTPTNFVDIFNTPGVTVTSAPGSGVTGTVTLNNGDTFNLTGITNGAGGWHAVTTPDAAGTGTDVFLATCYAAGTRILTATGERAIESLLQGDIVLTLSDGELKAQPLKWLGGRRIDLTAHPRPDTVAPIRIERDAIADNMPHTDLLVSPDHAIFMDGKLIAARRLINGSTIRREEGWPSVNYFHVELDAHAILFAEGLPAESYLDTGNRGFFANSGAPIVMHPDLTDETDYPTREAGSCAPLVWDEASVRPVLQQLAERAAAIGRPVPQRAITTDAGLRLRSDRTGKRTYEPIYSDSNLVIFTVPSRSEEVRLVSRAQSPTEARPWLDDPRNLGVHVKRIVLRSANELREIPVDHPDLASGWWAVERDGEMMARWTDGEAVLPLPAMQGPVMLEIHLAGSMTYVVDAAPEDETERRAVA